MRLRFKNEIDNLLTGRFSGVFELGLVVLKYDCIKLITAPVFFYQGIQEQNKHVIGHLPVSLVVSMVKPASDRIEGNTHTRVNQDLKSPLCVKVMDDY